MTQLRPVVAADHFRLAKSKRLSNTSDKTVVMQHRRGEIKILLSVEHGLTRRQDVNDAIRVVVKNDIHADLAKN